jgi:ABC-type lipoprotein release transport system permease subunit
LAERNFRKINKGIAKELEKNVTLNVFHLQMEKKNKRLHETLGVKPDGPLSFKELEDTRKHMKTYRSHRNVAEIEREFLNAVWNINHNNNNSDNNSLHYLHIITYTETGGCATPKSNPSYLLQKQG